MRMLVNTMLRLCHVDQLKKLRVTSAKPLYEMSASLPSFSCIYFKYGHLTINFHPGTPIASSALHPLFHRRIRCAAALSEFPDWNDDCLTNLIERY